MLKSHKHVTELIIRLGHLSNGEVGDGDANRIWFLLPLLPDVVLMWRTRGLTSWGECEFLLHSFHHLQFTFVLLFKIGLKFERILCSEHGSVLAELLVGCFIQLVNKLQGALLWFIISFLFIFSCFMLYFSNSWKLSPVVYQIWVSSCVFSLAKCSRNSELSRLVKKLCPIVCKINDLGFF